MTTSNDITVAGGLTRDPELRYGAGGGAVAPFSIACGRRYQKNGEWVEDTSFFDCVAFGALGEHVAASLRKGDRVIVSGRLEQQTWDDRDGNKRSKLQVIADEVGASLKWVDVEVQRQERTKTAADGTTTSRSQPQPSHDEDPF